MWQIVNHRLKKKVILIVSSKRRVQNLPTQRLLVNLLYLLELLK